MHSPSLATVVDDLLADDGIAASDVSGRLVSKASFVLLASRMDLREETKSNPHCAVRRMLLSKRTAGNGDTPPVTAAQLRFETARLHHQVRELSNVVRPVPL